MNTGCMIRQYSDHDYDSLVKMTDELHNYFVTLDLFGEKKVFSTQVMANQYFDQALQDVGEMDGVMFVAEENGNVVGFIQGVIVTHEKDVMHNLTHHEGTQGWIGLFFTDPKVRGRGIGKALLDKMKKYFQSKNCRSMRLKVSHNNELAISVYEKYGFTPRDIEMAMKI